MRGVVAAGHPLTAETGAAVLRDGGNAVDATLAALLMSWVTEPALTGPGAGGYLMVARPGEEPVLLDFFMSAPSAKPTGELCAATISFGDAEQVFHVGAASVATYGSPAGIAEAARRWATRPLAELAAPAVRAAADGVEVNAQQAYVFELLHPISTCTPEAEARYSPGGAPLRPGQRFRDAELARLIERLGEEGDEPFYRGDIAQAAADHMAARGGALTAADLAGYAAVARAPLHVTYGDREIVTNPPPSAGGILLAFALAQLAAGKRPPSPEAVVAAMEAAQAERTQDFLTGLGEENFAERFRSSRMGATTHISVVDADGMACSVTCTNGEGSAEYVPGHGLHLNNAMGEEDLSPLGFFSHPPGRRLPSMMAPTIVLREGVPELVIGSAGSNRIRSAILQVIVNVLDHGMDAASAVNAPRLHFENGTVYLEPGIDLAPVEHEVVRFRDHNMFFGGAQLVQRAPGGVLVAAGDPRRGGSLALG
jgi:gamma-glutamyltranspeptidase/glutathione hydrolase